MPAAFGLQLPVLGVLLVEAEHVEDDPVGHVLGHRRIDDRTAYIPAPKVISTRRFCGSRTPSLVWTSKAVSPFPTTVMAVAGTPSLTSMAGRMGGERVTVLNLTVHAVDAEKGLLLVKGAIPGPVGSIVLIREAAKGAAK